MARATICVALLSACSAPIVYPRPADVAQRVRVRVATDLPLVESKPDYGDDYRSFWHTVGVPLSAEGELSLPLAEVCEANGQLSVVRVGTELRCGLVQEARGAPFSLALAAAYLHHLDPLLFIPIDFDDEEGDGRKFVHWGALRMGVDFSFRLSEVKPLLGFYLVYAFRNGDLGTSHAGIDALGHGTGTSWVRDRLRLAVPLGVVLGEHSGTIAWTLGLSPELTVVDQRRDSDATGPLAQVKHRLSVLFTVGLYSQ